MQYQYYITSRAAKEHLTASMTEAERNASSQTTKKCSKSFFAGGEEKKAENVTERKFF